MASFKDKVSFLENKNVFVPIKEAKVDLPSKLIRSWAMLFKPKDGAENLIEISVVKDSNESPYFEECSFFVYHQLQ